MSKLIVVFGATGIQVPLSLTHPTLPYPHPCPWHLANKTHQGGSVAKTYLADPAWSVRAITRNKSSNAAQALASQGAEIVEADLDTPASLVTACAGATAIFAVTDFWAPFNEAYPRLMGTDRATGEYAYALETKRGQAVVDAAAKVLKEEGKLEMFIWSSLPPVKHLGGGGKYTYVYHFDAKAEVARYIEKEQKELWAKTSLLNMGFYMTNMIDMSAVFAPKKVCRSNYATPNKHTSPRHPPKKTHH